VYFGNNIENEDFGAIFFFSVSLTKILVCVLCIYSIAIIIKLPVSKCYDAILKLMWKRANCWDAKDLGAFFFLWCFTI